MTDTCSAFDDGCHARVTSSSLSLAIVSMVQQVSHLEGERGERESNEGHGVMHNILLEVSSLG